MRIQSRKKINNKIKEVGSFYELYECMLNATRDVSTVFALDMDEEEVFGVILNYTDEAKTFSVDKSYATLSSIDLVTFPSSDAIVEITSLNWKSVLESYSFVVCPDDKLIKLLDNNF